VYCCHSTGVKIKHWTSLNITIEKYCSFTQSVYKVSFDDEKLATARRLHPALMFFFIHSPEAGEGFVAQGAVGGHVGVAVAVV
jgi:hypothetical protein